MSDNRKPIGFLGKLPAFEVILVGGPCEGKTSICTHDTVYCAGNLYKRGPDDRYYWAEAGGENLQGDCLDILPTLEAESVQNSERELFESRGTTIKEQAAEIARLKDDFQKAKEWNQLCELQIRNLQGVVEDQDRLLTELADALDRSDPIQISIQEVAALIERARELVK